MYSSRLHLVRKFHSLSKRFYIPVLDGHRYIALHVGVE